MNLLALLWALATAAASPIDFAPCAHHPDQPGPATTPAEQAEVAAAIRAKVAQLGGSPTFARYLIAVATRESSLRPGVIHVDDGVHAAAAYRRLRKSHRRVGNPYADQPEIWLSYGLFGQNSNYFMTGAHRQADPRMLCELDTAVETYAAAARRVIHKMGGCVEVVTWADIHRAVQRGDVCPDGRYERIPTRLARLPTRLARLPVTAADLGR